MNNVLQNFVNSLRVFPWTVSESGQDLSCFYLGPLDEDDQPHGLCKLTYSTGDWFEGHFTHGEKNGNGKFFFFDGRYF